MDDKQKLKSAGVVAGSIVELLSVGMIYILSQIFVIFIIAAFGLGESSELSSRPMLVLSFYLIGGVVTISLTLGLMKLRKIGFSLLKFKKYHIKDLGYALVGYIIYMLIALFVSGLVRLIPGVDLDQKQELGLDTVSQSLLPLVFIALVIMPPLVEEILFRGFLYGRLRHHKLSPLFAAIITSVAFGVVHGQLNVAIDTFVLSMVMIYMLEKRKSLWVTITIHALKNAVAFLALFVFKIV